MSNQWYTECTGISQASWSTQLCRYYRQSESEQTTFTPNCAACPKRIVRVAELTVDARIAHAKNHLTLVHLKEMDKQQLQLALHAKTCSIVHIHASMPHSISKFLQTQCPNTWKKKFIGLRHRSFIVAVGSSHFFEKSNDNESSCRNIFSIPQCNAFEVWTDFPVITQTDNSFSFHLNNYLSSQFPFG